jgi:hypothetical protein
MAMTLSDRYSDVDSTTPDPMLTVMLHPPSWDPVAVANPSTALRALAHGFQHRLYDEEGEVAFRTLDEVKEVVRRGYTGGGLGFNPGPAPGPEPSPEGGAPELPLPQFSGENRDGERRTSWESVRDALATIGTNRDQAFERLQLFVQNNETQIADYHGRVATEYLPWFYERLSRDMRGNWRDAAMWFCGVGPTDESHTAMRAQIHPQTEAEYRAYSLLKYFSYYRRDWPFGVNDSRAILNGILFRIPLLTSLPGIKTFGDLIVGASTSRAFVRKLDARHLFLLLFIAMLVVRAGGAPRGWRNDWHRDLSDAARWLVDSMPAVLPPKHRAEVLLDRLVD